MKLDRTFLSSEKNFYKFLLLLFIAKLIYLFFIPITPQEAYYWYYSQNPDFSYFDHPPMAAYSIWLGTSIFGDNVFGVKFMAVVWSILTMLLLYQTTKRFIETFYKEKNKYALAFLTVILYNLTIFAHLYSVTIVPDTPLLFFWLLVVFSVQEFIITGNHKWWLLAGVGLGLGLVSKYPAIPILGSIFIFLIFSKKYRKEILNPYPYAAVVIAFILFSPVIYWNAINEWASFLFQSVERANDTRSIQVTYILQLIASQLFVLTPLLFIFFIKGIFNVTKNWRRYENLHLYYFSAMVIIGGFTLVSLTSLVKMNWLLPGYLTLLIIIVVLYSNKFLNPSKWIKTGIVFSLFLVIISYFILLIPNVPLGEGNTWSGWKDASTKIYKLQQELGGTEKCFIFSNSYKSSSLLKFYLPDQQDTYAKNIYGKRALQFDYWGIPQTLAGKNALYIFTDRREYENELDTVRKYFDEVKEIEIFEYDFFNLTHTRTIYCYYAKNYKGTDQ